MDRNSIYYKQVQLLVRILPFVAKEKCFALKGGTAINLFLRDFPRLSVDIDLVYLPIDDRTTALQRVSEALERIIQDIKASLPGVQVGRPNQAPDGLRLLIAQQGVQIKVELSPVLRGSVFPPEEKDVVDAVEATFGYASMQVMSFSDVYAGKICAALDRQHPRDLFDIKWLLENEGITDDLRKTFLVYLISGNRPMAELLNPHRKDIRSVYDGEFANMAEVHVSVEELGVARENLIQSIHQGLTEDEKRFLLSFKGRSPNWSLLGLKGIENLPAVKWKLLNLNKMPEDKHRLALDKLHKALNWDA
jgi:predicted nucleotidyltransferase component of viral defense system